MKKRFYLLLCASLLFANCSEPVVEKERKAISRGVYATKDSIDVSRYDLAKSYINETTRLVPPPVPKDRVKIIPFVTDSKPATKSGRGKSAKIIPGTPSERYVVLPDSDANTNVIVANSQEYKDLLTDNTKLALSEKKAWAAVDDLKNTYDGVIRDKDAELQKYRSKPGFFKRIWNFFTGLLKWGTLGFVILGGGLLVASIFVPGLLPFVFTIFRFIGKIISMFLGLITWGLLSILRLFKKK